MRSEEARRRDSCNAREMAAAAPHGVAETDTTKTVADSRRSGCAVWHTGKMRPEARHVQPVVLGRFNRQGSAKKRSNADPTRAAGRCRHDSRDKRGGLRNQRRG